ncbi:MAG: hypothetical protein JJU42_12820 [Rhodobacteraceae bacterium]|nr:hypothetical protein [Paracoccaceae bacterium]
MRPGDDLWRLETAFWTSGRDSARATTAAGAIVIYPYPLGILQGNDIWAHLPADTGWRLIEMADRSVTRQGPVAVLAYRVRAQKDATPIHAALCASTWLNDAGRWLRLSHQQTPVV